MDEKNINISKSEEELLEIMENRSHITADQLHRDIPKIIKFKATNSLRVSCLFCIFKHSPQKTV